MGEALKVVSSPPLCYERCKRLLRECRLETQLWLETVRPDYQPLTTGEHILRQPVSNVCPHLRYLHPSQVFFQSLPLAEGKLINQFPYLENKDSALFPFQRDFEIENWRVLQVL